MKKAIWKVKYIWEDPFIDGPVRGESIYRLRCPGDWDADDVAEYVEEDSKIAGCQVLTACKE